MSKAGLLVPPMAPLRRPSREEQQLLARAPLINHPSQARAMGIRHHRVVVAADSRCTFAGWSAAFQTLPGIP